jgi:hypothetical protein
MRSWHEVDRLLSIKAEMTTRGTESGPAASAGRRAGCNLRKTGGPMPHLDRTRLANELHDGVIQELSAILLQMETYQRRLETSEDLQTALADHERIKAHTRETLRQLRELVARIREK